ncbi:MAG: GTP-binding protein [Candidatus Buchananbacteria bacterium]|nr:GTP-binding protein [Candidatus Buchananbacteria bacterium]
MKKIFFLIINLALLTLITVTAFYLITQRTKIFAGSNYNLNKTLDVTIEEKIKEPPRTKPEEIEVKAIYLTSNSAASSKTIDKFIDFMKNTELNAVVIDIKDYSGTLSYDSQIDLVNQLDNDHNLIKDLPGLIQKLHDNNIYVIARQTVFQDPELSAKKPNWAVKNKSTGGLWYDYKGLTWTDPTQQAVWDYNLQIAKEAINLGFDEINFDYIRFPSDGPMKQMSFANLQGRTKAEVIAAFFEFLHKNLKDEPAYISGDLFGYTTEREDDMNIGQQIEDAALYFDYVCPMVYPSHYPSGHLNLANPAAHPYEVIGQAIQKGVESLQPVEIEGQETIEYRAKIRPWLQAFNIGAVYTPSMIDAQIQASKENGGFGYLLWNARNVYNYAPSN